jgi:hypothetical protein
VDQREYFIEAHAEEVRSIIEACHCSGCDGYADPEITECTCDFSERVDEVMEQLLEYNREVG